MIELIKTLIPARLLKPGMQIATDTFVVEGSHPNGQDGGWRIATRDGWVIVPSGDALVPVYCRINRRPDPARPISVRHKGAAA